MIIQPKATHEPSEPADPRKKFDFNTPEKRSRVPLYFALLITGIAAYLKSVFPAMSLAHSGDDGRDAPDPDEANAPSAGQAQADPYEQWPEIDDITTGSVGEEKPGNTITSIGLPWHSDFSLPDAPPLAYASMSEPFSPQLAAFFPAAFSYTPSNDNPAPVLPDTPASAGPADQDDTPPDPGDDTPDDDEDDTDDGEDDDDDDDDDDDEDPSDPANRAPVSYGPVRLRDVFAGQVVLIGLSELLFGATDPDGDVLSINDIVVSGGTLTQTGAGWLFQSMPGMLGTITFTYDISDGLVEIVQTAMLEIVRKVHVLTPGNDIYAATQYDDDIDALAGDDIVDARAGNDVVVGGAGDDHINGGDGDDQLFGGLGNDVVFGGLGNDIIGGGHGDDRLFGEEGNDIIDGDEGDDVLMGGAGDDVLDGGQGHDLLAGDDGHDVLEGGGGQDVISGGLGDDIIDGGAGDDTIQGNEGDDVITAGPGEDSVDAGEGDDTVEGGDDDDIIVGGAGLDMLFGQFGDDFLEGGDGNDTVDGGEGDDTVDGGDGLDALFGAVGDDVLIGGDGDDVIMAGPGDDTIDDGAGDDQVDAGAGDDTIIGSAGDDILEGGEGYDTLDYSGFTADIFVDLAAGEAHSGQIGRDIIAQIEEVIGGAGDDTIVIGTAPTVMTGGSGQDLFIFTVDDDDPTLSQQLMHEILDFVVGDRIRVAEYDISQRVGPSPEERFEELYEQVDPGFEGNLPIRVRHERYDDMDHTIIEADLDRDTVYEISINVHGAQLPMSVENNLG